MQKDGNENAGGQEYREFLREFSIHWHQNPLPLDGFLTGDQIGILNILIRNINRDCDCSCKTSIEDIADLTDYSPAKVKRILKCLTDIGILKTERTNSTAIRRFNLRALKLLNKIIDGQDEWAGYYLRKEMERKNIISIFDVTDEMVSKIRENAKNRYLSKFRKAQYEPSENENEVGKLNMSHPKRVRKAQYEPSHIIKEKDIKRKINYLPLSCNITSIFKETQINKREDDELRDKERTKKLKHS